MLYMGGGGGGGGGGVCKHALLKYKVHLQTSKDKVKKQNSNTC